jgi:outer membrane protein assembly factor BamB
VEAETGEVRWTVGRTVASYEPPVVTADTVFVRFNESIRALDKTDGTERWRTDAAIDRLALVDGTLYGIDGGTLLALR